MNYKYDVFISYSRRDADTANIICAALDRAGISYFIDRQGIAGGVEFPIVLAQAIVESQLFLFLASKNSYASKFTRKEITFAFNKKPDNSMLPYIIDNSQLPLDLEFVFSSINWRTKDEHPIETVLVDDLLCMLGRQARKAETPHWWAAEDIAFDVVLTQCGAAKLQVVKAVKEELRLGLKEAKDLVDESALRNVFLKEKLSRSEAERLKRVIEAAGATVEVRQAGRTKAQAAPDLYNVELSNAGAAKLQVVKAVKETFALGLKEAKDLVDGCPSIVGENLRRDVAERAKRDIERAGATVVLRKAGHRYR